MFYIYVYVMKKCLHIIEILAKELLNTGACFCLFLIHFLLLISWSVFPFALIGIL